MNAESTIHAISTVTWPINMLGVRGMLSGDQRAFLIKGFLCPDVLDSPFPFLSKKVESQAVVSWINLV